MYTDNLFLFMYFKRYKIFKLTVAFITIIFLTPLLWKTMWFLLANNVVKDHKFGIEMAFKTQEIVPNVHNFQGRKFSQIFRKF